MVEKLLKQYYDLYEYDHIRKRDDYFIVNEQYVYSIMTLNNNEMFYDEQNSLAKFCIEQGYEQFLQIIPNSFGERITNYENEQVIVCKASLSFPQGQISAGEKLAQFHQINYSYPYEPKGESSYGKWKELWVEKLSFFEEEILRENAKFKDPFLIRARNILPYIIGLSENAIQYLHENQWTNEYTDFDRGTICFQRYRKQLDQAFISFGELIYDHPVRDLSEMIRQKLHYSRKGPEESFLFLREYMEISSLSLFSFKLLYARLIYPVHFFDLFYRQLISREDLTKELIDLKKNQVNYEKGLKKFFELIERNYEPLPMHMLQWL